MSARLVGFTFVIVLCGVSLAHATLIGDDVTIEINFGIIPGSATYDPVTVIAGVVECPEMDCDGVGLLGPDDYIDIEAYSISIHFAPVSFGSLDFIKISGLDGPGMWPVSSIDIPVDFLDLTESDITVSEAGKYVNFFLGDVVVEVGNTVTVHFQNGVPAPEPTTAALLGTGLIALGLRRRRKA